MSLIKFNCLRCGQHIEAPMEMEGEIISCPSCNGRVTVRSPGRPETEAEIREKSIERQVAKLQHVAGELIFFGWAFVILAVLILLGSFYFAVTMNAKPEVYTMSAGIVCSVLNLGLILGVLGQLVHIRALLAKTMMR